MSDSNRGRGTSKLVFRLTQYLWYVGGVQCIITTLYFLYFCWTRQLVFTYFASPATYGLLTSEHFVSLQWWIFSLTALCIPPLYWMGLMLGHYYTRWMKMVWCYFMVPAELALWLITLAVDIYWITTKNDPAFPDNPANSNLACCTPEFYTTVVSCKNYLNPAPECNPSINLSELGTNGDMKFFFAVTLIMVGIFTLYLIISLYYMWGIDDLMQVSPLGFPLFVTT
jgi:hypothetical protein